MEKPLKSGDDHGAARPHRRPAPNRVGNPGVIRVRTGSAWR